MVMVTIIATEMMVMTVIMLMVMNGDVGSNGDLDEMLQLPQVKKDPSDVACRADDWFEAIVMVTSFRPVDLMSNGSLAKSAGGKAWNE